MEKNISVNNFYEISFNDDGSEYSDSFGLFIEKVCKAKDEGKISDDELKILIKFGANKMIGREVKESESFILTNRSSKKKKSSIFLKYLEMQHGNI